MAASHEAAAKAEALKAQADNVEAQKKKMEMERRQSKADLKMKALEEAMKIMSGQQTERSSRVVEKSGIKTPPTLTERSQPGGAQDVSMATVPEVAADGVAESGTGGEDTGVE